MERDFVLSKEEGKVEEKTNEKIIRTALGLFAKYGYYGTSMRDIAQELGITKPALYRHFSGKEEILEVIINSGEAYYENNIALQAANRMMPKSLIELKQLSLKQIAYTLHDKKVVSYRKLLSFEQFRNNKMAQTATKHFRTDLEDAYTDIFESMMDQGILEKKDAALLALEYVAPITMLIHQCDREPQKEKEILACIEKHIDFFLEQHKKKGN